MKVYSVSEVTQAIKHLLEGEFPEIWIEGEISNFRPAASGHFYFSLKDSAAQIRVVMFRGSNLGLRFRPENGLSVLCCGRVTVYEPRGDYQVIAEHLEPKGIGAFQLAFDQLKKKLEAEGLFAPERKRKIPFLPRKIGIITSPAGAVIRDMIQILTRRFPGIQILLCPVAVQGNEAAGEIAEALALMNERDDLDLLIVGRGGGSLEDLWAFNEEAVARAIAASRIPVISAVGHETDFTIADFVADLRAPTPSAAAELAVPVQEELLLSLQQERRRLRRALERRLIEPLLRVDSLREEMVSRTRHRLDIAREGLARLLRHLQSLSPLAILERGYAIATLHGDRRPLRSAGKIRQGSRVDIRLHEGTLLTELVRAIKE